MDRPLLNDKDVYPDDSVLAEYLGDTKTIWDNYVKKVSDNYPQLTFEWRYYNDGKAWLCKLAYKKKTISWISVWDKHFKVGFYFNERTSPGLKELDIDQDLKDDFFLNHNTGKFRMLRVEVRSDDVLNDLMVLIDYKKKAK